MSAFNFEVGQSVEYAWDTIQWYSAVVSALNDDGTYDIHVVDESAQPSWIRRTEDSSTVELNWQGWDDPYIPGFEVTNENADGTFNLRLLQKAVTVKRLRMKKLSRFEAGQTVDLWNEGQWRPAWYPAIVVAFNSDRSYDVEMNEENVDPSLIQGDTEVGSTISLNWHGAGVWFPDFEVIRVNANGSCNLRLLQKGVDQNRLREGIVASKKKKAPVSKKKAPVLHEKAPVLSEEIPVVPGVFNVDDSVEYFWGENAYNDAERNLSLGASVWNRTTKVVKVHQRPNDYQPVYDVEMSILDANASRITSCSGESISAITPDEMVKYQYNEGGQPFEFRVVKKNDDGTVHLVLLSENVHASFLRHPPTEADRRNPYLYAPPGWY